MRSQDLQHSTTLVTGASSGIGRALCTELAARGANVILVGRDATRLEESRSLLAHPERHLALAVDLADTGALEALSTRAVAFGKGKLRALIHNAGTHAERNLENVGPEQLDATLAVNLRAPILLTSLLAPALCAARGDVAFINSSAVFFPRAGLTEYTASKAGLRGFADALRAELNPSGVRVLSVFVGRTATAMQRELAETKGHAYKPELLLQPEDVARAVVDAMCLNETAELTELQIRPRHKS